MVKNVPMSVRIAARSASVQLSVLDWYRGWEASLRASRLTWRNRKGDAVDYLVLSVVIRIFP
jgi:hypothetical protein